MRRAWWVVAAGVAAVGNQAAGYQSDWLTARFEASTFQRWAVGYREEQGVLPVTDAQSTWFEKLRAHDPFVLSDAETRAGLPIDPWGHPYVYRAVVAGPTGTILPLATPVVRSCGADGIDNGGALDDLSADRWINDGYYCYRNRPLARKLGWIFGCVILIVTAAMWSVRVLRNWALWVGAYGLAVAVVICIPLMKTPWNVGGMRAPPWQEWGVVICSIALFGLPVLCAICKGLPLASRFIAPPRPDRCLSCGYSLVGLPRTVVYCPECGTVRAAEDAAR